MKINEKNLVYFASSDTPIDKDGWLLKRGDVNKSFQKRWFVLKGNLLFYFEKKTEKEPVGVIILEGCTIELAENEEQYTFKLVFHCAGGRTYILGADTQESMEAWMKALACASYDYMKLMVAELQRQMDELVALEKATPPLPPSKPVSPSPKPPPRQHGKPKRINPFNRCQSEEDMDRSASSSAKAWHPNSVPNTPVPVRPAPPPPQQAVAAATITPLPTQRVMQAELQTSGEFSSNGSINPMPRKTFHDLHEQYGQKIRHQLWQWQQERSSKKHENHLVELD